VLIDESGQSAAYQRAVMALVGQRDRLRRDAAPARGVWLSLGKDLNKSP
jgi:hypothetical protein